MFKKLFRVQICKLEQRVCGDEFPGAPSRPYNPYPAPRPPPNLENKDKDQHKNRNTKIEDNQNNTDTYSKTFTTTMVGQTPLQWQQIKFHLRLDELAAVLLLHLVLHLHNFLVHHLLDYQG